MPTFKFLPTEENFFELFDEISDILVAAAKTLRDLVVDYHDVDRKTHELREMEKHADRTTRDVCRRLYTSFITPIDREDIHALAVSMDAVLDYIEASADRMKLYGIDEPRPEALELAELIIEGTELIKKAVAELSHFRDTEAILRPCVAINDVENRADAVHRRALMRLFEGENRPLDIAKWHEIFDRLETATDRCEDVANVLESVVIKNA